ncbi:MAG: hypothetical protein U0441_09115 [Polyangiaceae bacterium]
MIEAIETAAPLLSRVQKAHEGLKKSQAQPQQIPEKLQEIQKKQAELDKLHDRKGRGSYLVLSGFAELVDDPEMAADILALRDKIFDPAIGLRVLQASYAEEAGEVVLLEERLDDADLSLLKKMPCPKGSLLDAHHARVTAGKKLGSLEHEKNTLQSDQGSAPGEVTMPADVLRARNAWIKAARALVQVLDLDDLDAPTRAKIVSPLEEAERKADSRAAGKAAPADATPAKPQPEDGKATPA